MLLLVGHRSVGCVQGNEGLSRCAVMRATVKRRQPCSLAPLPACDVAAATDRRYGDVVCLCTHAFVRSIIPATIATIHPSKSVYRVNYWGSYAVAMTAMAAAIATFHTMAAATTAVAAA